MTGCGSTALTVDAGSGSGGSSSGSGGAAGGSSGSGGAAGNPGSGGSKVDAGTDAGPGACKPSECSETPPFAAPVCDGGPVEPAACLRAADGTCHWRAPRCAVACPALGCLPNCPYGVKVDGNGCQTCQCNPTPPVCPKIACAKDCPNGQVSDANGCPTCECKPGPMCGPVCDIFCEFGNVQDANGCPTCKCNPPPQPTSCDVKKCPLPAPGAPNYICPDGKTIAGPACVTQANGACGWAFISCPPKCDPLPCPSGAPWDPAQCKCVTPACSCPVGEVCVQQIGGPAIKTPPAITCEKPNTACFAANICGCLSQADGACKPSNVSNLCVCDNGIR